VPAAAARGGPASALAAAEAPGWALVEGADPLATSKWSPSMGCRRWARGEHWRQTAGRRLAAAAGC
jgi:hypothetical protein